MQIQNYKARFFLFFSALFPSTIWLLSRSRLSNPLEDFLWTIVCASAVAFSPGRIGPLFSAWLQLFLTPLTFLWVGSVAITGSGPSGLLIDAALTAGKGEISTSIEAALSQQSVIFVATLTMIGVFIALRVAKNSQISTNNFTSLIFIFSLMLISVVVADRKHVFKISPLEVKSSVPLISDLVMLQEVQQIHNASVMSVSDWKPANSKKLFQVRKGLAVFVVGESMRTDSLLKEDRGPWSRLLRDRLEKGLGIRVADACAYGNSTQISVPRLLTLADVDDNSDFGKKPTILAMLKAAGATTAYIYNQVPPLVKEKGHDFISSASGIDYSVYDDVVVEMFSEFLAKSGKGPKAAILHLKGQHYLYADRYPPEIFSPPPKNLSSDALEELEYNRAAEYGVKVLLDLAKALDEQEEPAYLVFTSDHGENLRSDGLGKKYHASSSPTRYDSTVPVLFLWNKSFIRSGRLKDIEALLKADGLIAHRDVARSWLALAGMPGKYLVTKNPRTLIGLAGTNQKTPIACSDLAR